MQYSCVNCSLIPNTCVTLLYVRDSHSSTDSYHYLRGDRQGSTTLRPNEVLTLFEADTERSFALSLSSLRVHTGHWWQWHDVCTWVGVICWILFLPAITATRARCPIFNTTNSQTGRERGTEGGGDTIVRQDKRDDFSHHMHSSNKAHASPSAQEGRPCGVRGQRLVGRDAFWLFGE